MITQHLEPNRVFHYFETICSIPHGSGNTKKISDFCVEFAKKHGLDFVQDSTNNVIIYAPASNGYESHPPLILQGHLDMVCEKEPTCPIDFLTDGLDLVVDGDYLRANETTLGADDGIAVAMILAVLEDKTLPHPPIEAVFTVDEETGMDGASALDPNLLNAKRLLNLDSEEEGVLTVACAGGAHAEAELLLSSEEIRGGKAQRVVFSGLKGGHSGAEIDKKRLNATILMGQFLRDAAKTDKIRIVSLFGGTKDNAIPNRSECTLVCDRDLSAFAARFAEEHRTEQDPNLTASVTAVPAPQSAFSADDSERIANLLSTLPDGVIAMSREIPELVQTSLNLGQTATDPSELHLGFLIRSSVNAERHDLVRNVRKAVESFGGTFRVCGEYSAWEYRADSPLRDTVCRVLREQSGTTPRVEAIHAGLECGFFCEKIPDLDAVSIGPDIPEIHTPRERLSIPSVERTYRLLCSILKEL